MRRLCDLIFLYNRTDKNCEINLKEQGFESVTEIHATPF